MVPQVNPEMKLLVLLPRSKSGGHPGG